MNSGLPLCIFILLHGMEMCTCVRVWRVCMCVSTHVFGIYTCVLLEIDTECYPRLPSIYQEGVSH